MTDTLLTLPIEKITLGRNPRTKFDPEQLQQLAESIKSRGQKQPIVVEPHKRGTYILVMGERRLRAHQLLGRKTIQAYVRSRTNQNGRERFLDAVIENDQRQDMTKMETARAYQILRDEYGFTIRQLARQLGKAETVIGALLTLNDLDPEIQALIEEGFWTEIRLVRGLLAIDDKETRVQLARKLWDKRVPLNGCLAAVTGVRALAGKPARRAAGIPRGASPARVLAEADEKPARWDMLRQLGRVPEWDVVVSSAESTCATCPLRSMASVSTCSDCGAVTMLRKMMEATR